MLKSGFMLKLDFIYKPQHFRKFIPFLKLNFKLTIHLEFSK